MSEIRGKPGVVVLHLVVQFDRYLADGIPFFLGNETRFLHLTDDEIPPLQRFFGIQDGIVAGGFVHHADQHRALLHRQFSGWLPEEGFRGGTHSVGAASEEDGIEIHRHDLLGRVIPFQFDRRDPFLQLGPDHPDLVDSGNIPLHLDPRVQGFRQLLRDGGSASLAGSAEQDGFEQDAP